VLCDKIRLNTNGSIDASFVTGAGFNDNVTALAIQPNGKFLSEVSLQCIKALQQIRSWGWILMVA
jgi:hypothetical protein